MLPWRPFPLSISTIDVNEPKWLSVMELRQYQIHGHTSPSVFIVEYVAWLCIVVEGSMLMQSTECGENLIGDICIDFSQTFQDQLLLNQPERKSRQFEVMRKVVRSILDGKDVHLDAARSRH